MRPFISGHVANSMAAEVIALLHGLLTAVETRAAKTWVQAVEKVRRTPTHNHPRLIAWRDDKLAASSGTGNVMML